jgi:hypothetical protein
MKPERKTAQKSAKSTATISKKSRIAALLKNQ